MPIPHRCYTKSKSGYKYYSTVVRDVVTVQTLGLCSARCGEETFCNSFSFRSGTSQDRDNCLLSNLQTEAILPSSDLVRDPSWDVWQQSCQGSAELPCWRLATDGSKLKSSRVDTTSAVSGLPSCSQRCAESRTCRTFAFATSGYTNCQLSSTKVANLNSWDMVRDT